MSRSHTRKTIWLLRKAANSSVPALAVAVGSQPGVHSKLINLPLLLQPKEEISAGTLAVWDAEKSLEMSACSYLRCTHLPGSRVRGGRCSKLCRFLETDH